MTSPSKMKLSDDQRKVVKSISLYTLASAIVFPLSHLVKGNFDWKDTLCYDAIIIAVGLAIGLFFIIGMKMPKK